ncbi:MAG TPA: hypothetical protein VF101_03460 [Gaiellaceae bacterium]
MADTEVSRQIRLEKLAECGLGSVSFITCVLEHRARLVQLREHRRFGRADLLLEPCVRHSGASTSETIEWPIALRRIRLK